MPLVHMHTTFTCSLSPDAIIAKSETKVFSNGLSVGRCMRKFASYSGVPYGLATLAADLRFDNMTSRGVTI